MSFYKSNSGIVYGNINRTDFLAKIEKRLRTLDAKAKLSDSDYAEILKLLKIREAILQNPLYREGRIDNSISAILERQK